LVSEGWRRHPADLARLIGSLVLLGAALAFTVWKPDAVVGLSRDLLSVLSWVPDLVTEVVTGLAQLLALTAPVVLVAILLVQRRFRLVAVLAAGVAAAAGSAALLQSWLDERVPPQATSTGTASWITGDSFPSAAYIAALAAVMTILGPSLPRRWRRLVGWTLAIAVLLRLITAVAVPVHIGVALLIGVAVGSAVLVVVGGPSRKARPGELVDGFVRLRIDPETVVRSDRDDRFIGSTTDGTSVIIDLVDRDDRDAELFLRALNAIRVRGIDDEHPGWSTERVAEHEALVTLLAAGVARVPEVVGVDVTDSGAALLVTRDRAATPLDEIDDGALTDRVLLDAWHQVAALHSRRIAHRLLDRHHLVLDDETDEVGITNLRRAQTGADDMLLSIDVAELLTSFSLVVGPERAVATAVDVLGASPVAASLPVLQPLALSSRTRKALKATGERKQRLAELRTTVQDTTGSDPVELLPMQRLSIGRIVSLVGTVFLLYVALAFVANWDEFVDALKGADWTFLPGIIVASALGYPAAAVSLMGAVTVRLALGQTSEVMLAQSFLNRFTPANAGGMALRIRYVQINGVDIAVAAASIGLTSVASGVMQVIFLVVFLTWSSQGGSLPFSFPDAATLALILLGFLVLCGILWLTPLRHKVLDSRAYASAGEILAEIRQLAKSPTKVVMLFGGAGVAKLLTIIAFTQSCRAFGIDIAFQDLAALYMTANTVASAAPTPGGVGAIEAALIAALVSIQVEPGIAFSAVMVFRLINFWAPVPFAWVALQDLRRKEIV
jgi:undecaprenyl-diphosphatase